MWRRGLLYTLLAATVAATATDGETKGAFLVKNTPFEKTAQDRAEPGSLDIAGLKLRAQRMSSCACEMAYACYIFIGCLAAYFMAKTAAERLEKFKHLVRMLSVFLVHYSRDLAIAQIPVPLISAMELCTSSWSSKGQKVGKRPSCDIEARQNEVGSSFYADSYCSRPVLITFHGAFALKYPVSLNAVDATDSLFDLYRLRPPHHLPVRCQRPGLFGAGAALAHDPGAVLQHAQRRERRRRHLRQPGERRQRVRAPQLRWSRPVQRPLQFAVILERHSLTGRRPRATYITTGTRTRATTCCSTGAAGARS